jgi:phage baseplate assembly protein W
MSGYGARLPFVKDGVYGFGMLTDIESVAKQNLKMLILTAPGERIMDPNFGVGIKKFLFEPLNQKTKGRIQSKIMSQAKKYLSYIKISSVEFTSLGNQPAGNISLYENMDPNFLGISIRFTVVPTGGNAALELSF